MRPNQPFIEQRRSVAFWRTHIENLRCAQVISPNSLRMLIGLGVTEWKRFGSGDDQIRPGRMGQFDVYCLLITKGDTPSPASCLLLAGLTAAEIVACERVWEVEAAGFDPNNDLEVAEFLRIQWMDEAEIALALADAEKRL